MVPYLVDNAGVNVLSYDDPESVTAKGNYIKAGGELGGMFWDDGGTIMFNFAVLGFEVGYKISFFAEGGWGQVGLFTIGAKLAF